MVSSSPASRAVLAFLLLASPMLTPSRRVKKTSRTLSMEDEAPANIATANEETANEATANEEAANEEAANEETANEETANEETANEEAANDDNAPAQLGPSQPGCHGELKLGPKDGPLVPALVTKDVTAYQLREKWKLGNNYKIKTYSKGCKGNTALKMEGKWRSKFFGHGSMHVKDPATGQKLFKVRKARHTWNPKEWVGRFSFRILPPGSEDDDDAIYTINKDYLGRGVLWAKEEWRIYRGRKRDGQLVYYCVGSWLGFSMKCYNSVRDYDTGRKGINNMWTPPDVRDLPKLTPVLKTIQKLDKGTVGDVLGGMFSWLPNALYLSMEPEADAALLLAFAAIIDTAHDQKAPPGTQMVQGGLSGLSQGR